MTGLNETARKIIKAALTETNPTSIAAATSLTVQAVYANLNALKKRKLATYDTENKVLTLTAEGIRVANEVDAEPAKSSEPEGATNDAGTAGAPEQKKTEITIKVEVTGSGTKKEKAWAIINAMTADAEARGVDLDRKSVVEAIQEALSVSVNNASQYIQNYRKAHGMVVPRAPKAEVEGGQADESTTPTVASTDNEYGLGVDEVNAPKDTSDTDAEDTIDAEDKAAA